EAPAHGASAGPQPVCKSFANYHRIVRFVSAEVAAGENRNPKRAEIAGCHIVEWDERLRSWNAATFAFDRTERKAALQRPRHPGRNRCIRNSRHGFYPIEQRIEKCGASSRSRIAVRWQIDMKRDKTERVKARLERF